MTNKHSLNEQNVSVLFKPAEIENLNSRFEKADPDSILAWSWKTFRQSVVLGTGFGPSGILLIHRIFLLKLKIPVFYLDTHLLFDETYALRDELEKKLNISFISVSTNLSVEEQHQLYGKMLWETKPDQCCYLRKVLPLKKYLNDKKGWITGLRRDQSESRQLTRIIEWDPHNKVIKINPLAHWSTDEVWGYINDHKLPYNPLHDYRYPSIGCRPCTSPVSGDFSERSGRWKGSDKTECGIHLPTQNKNGSQ